MRILAAVAGGSLLLAALPAAATVGAAGPVATLADLPLVEVEATGPAASGVSLFAVLLSGAGGWAALDRGLADALAARGIPVVGWKVSSYLGERRTPEGTGADLARVLRHYLASWNKREILLVGYSMGAENLPFMAVRLPPDLARRVRLVVLLSPSPKAVFEFHTLDWLRSTYPDDALSVAPEVEKLRGTPVLCLYGEEETDSLCPRLAPGLARIRALGGGHHYDGRYAELAEAVLAELRATSPRR